MINDLTPVFIEEEISEDVEDDDDEEYEDGRSDGYNGRALKRNTPAYAQGYADGVDGREYSHAGYDGNGWD